MPATNRDGHKLTLTLGPDYRLTPDIVCPGDCRLWHPDVPEGERKDPCWLRDFVHDVGSEFLEYWSSRDGGKPVPLAGPIEIEWWGDGYGEDFEMWWRPVSALDEERKP